MDAVIKEHWVRALRSGQYRQTRGLLHGYNVEEENPQLGFCCLGVLCDLSRMSHREWEWTPVSPGRPEAVFRSQYVEKGQTCSDYESVTLPWSVVQWAGLGGDTRPAEDWSSVRLPFDDRRGHQVYLTTANDCGCTFDQIADLIEHFL